ncbi:hypothetical protein [Riemerella anatipestifer]|uniref:Uncharacterized protein n=1 Tax=Riemerella anatipestifer TaxID=34085 RepID=A0A1S7DV61_RIEAN|nr:hypothetical protein [Riemerella anatipestifer]AQY22996.1 hypothetical protein AB406_2056 [Riemerella anatipestifer]MBT0556826.1 hypothetical protein [Riemerella anatipestifer]MCO7355749.1 hypothetical protein [Riemerella anatipestifer]MDY3525068.1 hypothetical protein [Riemerella anatipestifer]NAV17208.1 hypothetical protein [Riemerella anatipestifer]
MTDLDFLKQIKRVLGSLTLNEQGELVEPSLMNALELLDKFKETVIKDYLKAKKIKNNEYQHDDTTAEAEV